MHDAPTVFVVDDESQLRDSLRRLVESVGIAVETFDSAEAFLEAFDASRTGCLLVDVRMPGRSGIELQTELTARGSILPVIVITAHGEVPLAVQAMRQGALDFVEKPFSQQLLLDRIREGIDRNLRERESRGRKDELTRRVGRLTPRERQVMERVLTGAPNRIIAETLGIREKTVEFHRRNLMEKLEVGSVAELARIGFLVAQPVSASGNSASSGH